MARHGVALALVSGCILVPDEAAAPELLTGDVMALDRFVKWINPRRHPTRRQALCVCIDFLGGVGQVEWNKGSGRIIIDLPGTCTSPFKSARPTFARPFDSDQKRWIEVFLHGKSDGYVVDVITRQHDDFTNGLADRLAEVFARGWEGEVET